MTAFRLDTIRGRIAELGVDAVLLTFLPDIRWAVGFTGSNAVLLVTGDQAHFVTDGRYREQARNEVLAAEVHVPGYKLFEHIVDQRLLGTAETCLVQADSMTIDELERLRSMAQETRFQPASNLLSQSVASKSPSEIDAIRSAQRITEQVFEDILPLLKPGVRESEIGAEIVYRHLLGGCERMAFDPIVASGPRGALPHASPSQKKIAGGELVVIDMGGVKDGYASDMTRTVAIGEPGDKARKVYNTVLDAQNAAIDGARAGMTGRELDRLARAVIEKAGHGDAFPHSLGHGIGLQTHEWPSISSRNEEPLPNGAAITIEPGVYLNGEFGVRIEDIIVLSQAHCENLTRAPKELLVL